MRAVLVVIANIVKQKSPQMAFVHRNNVIQQLSPTSFDPALRHPVLPRTLERGLRRLNPEGSHGSGNLHSVPPVPVEDQKPGSQAKRKVLPQLRTTHRLVGCLVTLRCRTHLRSLYQELTLSLFDGGCSPVASRRTRRSDCHRGSVVLSVAGASETRT